MFKQTIKHLEDNYMTYWEHFRFASGYGVNCIYYGLLLILHSLIPAYFGLAGGKLTNELNKVFTDQNEYLSLKIRVEAFKKIVYNYPSKELKQ
jgi:hypothetical protein